MPASPLLRYLLAGLCLAAALGRSAVPRQPGLLLSEPIFQKAPFESAHASTIVETKDGLVSAWFGGPKEGHPDTGIWLSRQSGGAWLPPVEVANGAETEDPKVHCKNPVLFHVPGGPLLLFYKTGEWWGYIKRSADSGRTWSKPQKLPNGFVGPVKNKPVLLADGTILCPSSTELKTIGTHAWRVQFERSTDGGATWEVIGPVNDGVTMTGIQPSILIHPGNRLQAIGRTRRARFFEVWSEDGGKTWGEMTLLDLPNGNAGSDAVTLRDGRHLLVYNHSGFPPGGGKPIRSPLCVAISADGKSWKAALVLENEPNSQFSYPAVIQTSDGLVHVAYTWKRKHIQHTVIDPGRLETRGVIAGGKWPE